MKNRKMKLKEISVKSFVTKLHPDTYVTVKGGLDSIEQYGCGGGVDSLSCMSNCECNNSLDLRCDHDTLSACVGNNTQQNSINNCTQEC